MNDPVYNQLRESSWRRKLTEAEEARLRELLASHPEAKEDWEIEAGLNRILEHLPEAPPVSSNFTARVLQALEREAAAQSRAGGNGWRAWWSLSPWRWMPRAAIASLALGLGVMAYHQRQINVRTAMARDVVEFTQVVFASDPELMENFELIRRLGDSQPKADTELLALMK